MELLGDVGHVKSGFVPFGDGVSVSARYVHGLLQTYHRLRNHFGQNRWNSWLTRLKWMLILVHLEIVVILKQNSWMVCAERSIGSEIILDTSDGTPCGILFWSIWRQS
jgi:hypothetical protein